ncbi:MAG TPA: hypothetical protein VEI57_14485, partial [Nitrospirota bacterium]|nr:hypothetical protein [Nitrospirota bacterium]
RFYSGQQGFFITQWLFLSRDLGTAGLLSGLFMGRIQSITTPASDCLNYVYRVFLCDILFDNSHVTPFNQIGDKDIF